MVRSSVSLPISQIQCISGSAGRVLGGCGPAPGLERHLVDTWRVPAAWEVGRLPGPEQLQKGMSSASSAPTNPMEQKLRGANSPLDSNTFPAGSPACTPEDTMQCPGTTWSVQLPPALRVVLPAASPLDPWPDPAYPIVLRTSGSRVEGVWEEIGFRVVLKLERRRTQSCNSDLPQTCPSAVTFFWRRGRSLSRGSRGRVSGRSPSGALLP